MNSIKFFYMPESPPCRAVEMVANMVGVKLEKHYLNLSKQEHLSDSYKALNPLRKVPFIINGDLRLGESRAIMAYLVNKYKPNDEHLYPQSNLELRAKIDELLQYDAGTLWPAKSRLFWPKIFGSAKEFDQNDEKALRRCLNYLNNRLGQNQQQQQQQRFFLSNELSIADISLAASFTFTQACDFNMDEHKNLLAYLERLRASIPNYGDINDEPCENMRKFFDSIAEAK